MGTMVLVGTVSVISVASAGAAAPAIGVIGAGFSALVLQEVLLQELQQLQLQLEELLQAQRLVLRLLRLVFGVTGVVTGGATVPAMTAMAAMGPVGWVGIAMLGADTDGLSWDCWKPVLHDESATPSSGKPMKEVVSDPRVKKITVDDGKLTLVNVWDEKFQVTYFDIPGFGIAAHADKLEE